MSDAYGMKGHVGISFQSSFGTLNQSSMDYFPIISESLTDDIADLLSEGMKGRFEEGASYEGEHAIKGDLVFEAHPILLGKVMKAWFGQSSGSLVGSVYTHEYLPREQDWDDMAAVPPMTIEVFRDTGSAYLYYDTLADALQLEIGNGALWRVSMGVVGGRYQKINKSTPSYLPGDSFSWDSSSLSLAGSAIDDISKLTVKCNNNLEAKHTLDGTKFPNRIKRNGFRTIEINGTLIMVDLAQADAFFARTQQRLITTIKGMTLTGSQNTQIYMDIPKMLYIAFPMNIGGPGQIEVGFTGKAKFDETSNYIARFTMQNTKVAY